MFIQTGSKSCGPDIVLHLHFAMDWNWSTVEPSCATPFQRLQEHMVAEFALYS
jgi:hypothetical protein